MKTLCALILLLATPALAYDEGTESALRFYKSCLKTATTIEMRNTCTMTYNDMINMYSAQEEQLPPPPPDYNPGVVCLGYGGGFAYCY